MRRGRSGYFVVGLAGGVGGALQAIFFGFMVTRVFVHLGDPAWTPDQDAPALMRLEFCVGLVLLVIGLLGLVVRYFKPLTLVGALGGLVAACGFGLWAYGLGTEWVALPDLHLHPLLVPGLVAAGSFLFGLLLFRAQAPKLGAILIAFLGPAGLVGLFGPGLSAMLGLAHAIPQSAAVLLATYTVLLLSGLGWSSLGFSI